MARFLARWTAIGTLFLFSGPAHAVDVQGTVSFEGQLLFETAVAGVPLDGMRVRVMPQADATAPGVRCSILATTADGADAGGLYPDLGTVSAEVLMERGGPQQPDGGCMLTLHASGSDGAEVTAHGTTTVLATAVQIDANATLSPPVLFLRGSKAHAALSKECKSWSKSRVKLRDKCNAKILLLGGTLALEKCKEPGPEPLGCDPGDQTGAVLDLAHGANDQQIDVASGEAVDRELLAGQRKCQVLFGKAARKYFSALAARIQTECVKPGEDSEDCRSQQAAALRAKLDAVDSCAADAVADGATGRVVPAVGDSCSQCIAGPDVDAKCLKDCFETHLAQLASNLVGDAPVCGDGILQNGEFCDDGNLADGDCCSSFCGVEVPGTQVCGVGACQVTAAMCMDGEPVSCEPGSPPSPDESGGDCSNLIDDDCDGATDGEDSGCTL